MKIMGITSKNNPLAPTIGVFNHKGQNPKRSVHFLELVTTARRKKLDPITRRWSTSKNSSKTNPIKFLKIVISPELVVITVG